jgi:hypothetical protein
MDIRGYGKMVSTLGDEQHARQGLTLVHFSGRSKHVLWDTLCLWAGSMTRNCSDFAEKWTSVSPLCEVRGVLARGADAEIHVAAVAHRAGLRAGGVKLGWGFQIRTDSVEGRIRADSGGFQAAPHGILLRYFTVCMGILTLEKWIPDSHGFGRGSDSDGFGRIAGPQI